MTKSYRISKSKSKFHITLRQKHIMTKSNKRSILHKSYKKASHHERKQDTMIQTQQKHVHEIKKPNKMLKAFDLT